MCGNIRGGRAKRASPLQFPCSRYNFGVISAFLYNRATHQLQTLEREAILSSRPEAHEAEHAVQGGFARTKPACRADELMWIDVTDPTPEDYELLAQRFDLHEMVVEDIKAREGRPKLHDYNEYLYLIFHALEHSKDGDCGDDDLESQHCVIHLQEIDCLVGPDYVVTLHPDALKPFDDLRSRWQHNPQLMQSGAGYLLYELMDEILDDYFPVLDSLDERIDDFEDRLFQEFEDKLSADIFSLKRSLLQVRRIAGPTRDVINVLLRRDADSGGKHFAYFQDLYDHANRIVDMVDSFRELLSGALDAYLAMASNRMNAIMKTMTAASIILLVPTLIAGIYGMNFENMPELKMPFGYYGALGAMATTIIGLVIYFRRKGWL